MNLVLVGMRGVGKTTVARWLAPRLGLPMVDADEAIEARWGRTVTEIFAQRGEATFRQWEEETCLDLLREAGRVLSLGGGAVMTPSIAQAVRRQRLPIWLRASPDVLVARLSAAPRPPLTARPLAEEVEELCRRRAAHYAWATTHMLSTDDRSIEEVGYGIEQLWRDLPDHHLR